MKKTYGSARKPSMNFWAGFWTGLGALSFLYSYKPQGRKYPGELTWRARPRLARIAVQVEHERAAP